MEDSKVESVGEPRANYIADRARRDREAKSARYRALIDDAIERAKKPKLALVKGWKR